MWNLAKILGLLSLCAMPLSANAQDYPMKPIRLVVPFPPGGPNDTIGRVVGQKMQDLNATDLEGAINMIAGTARSMGLVVEG